MSSKVASIRFNQDMSCFLCLTDGALRVFNVDPLMQMLHLSADIIGRARLAEMLYRSNLIAVVSTAVDHPFPENVLRVWDASARAFHASVTFSSAVLDARLRRDKLVVVLLNEVHVFAFPGLHRLAAFDTRDNPAGLCQVSRGGSWSRQTAVFPGLGRIGTVRIVDLGALQMAVDDYGPDRPRVAKAEESAEATLSSAPSCVQAHENEIACLAVNADGALFATASARGTIVRVFDSLSRERVAELRRGADPATMHCLAFSADSRYLCASSDKGSVHVYAIADDDVRIRRRSGLPAGAVTVVGARSLAGAFSGGDCRLGIAHFAVPDRCACAFDADGGSSVVAVCVDGSFHKYVFATAAGGCTREAFDRFIELGDNCEM